jgi:hypothetical protein
MSIPFALSYVIKDIITYISVCSPELAARIEAPHRSRGRGFQAIELVAGALDGKTVRGDFPAAISPVEKATDD